MKTREEIEKEIKDYEATLTKFEVNLDNDEIPPHALQTVREHIARLDAQITVLKWVLGDSNE